MGSGAAIIGQFLNQRQNANEARFRQQQLDKQAAEDRAFSDFIRQGNPNLPPGVSPEALLVADRYDQEQRAARQKEGINRFITDAASLYTPSQIKGAGYGKLPSRAEARQDLLAFGIDQGMNPEAIDQAAVSLEKFLTPVNKIENYGGTPYAVNEEAGTMAVPAGFEKPAGKYTVESDVNGDLFYVPEAPGGNISPVGMRRGQSGGGTPYYTPVQTADGIYTFNNRTGAINPLDVNGRAVVGSASDPVLQGRIEASKASGREIGTATAQAKIDLPRDIQEAENTISLIDNMLEHPGLSQAVGKSSVLGVQNVPGTDAKSFMISLNQLKGKQFLQAFQSLKGGGQITEVEGKKATEAMSRMDNANTEKDFIAASREFQDIVRQGVARAKAKAAGGSSPPAPTGEIRFLGFE